MVIKAKSEQALGKDLGKPLRIWGIGTECWKYTCPFGLIRPLSTRGGALLAGREQHVDMSGENPFQKNLSKMVLSHEWGCDGKNVGEEICFSCASPSPTHLQSSLPVTVFAFVRKNGLLVWRVAPELTSVETM